MTEIKLYKTTTKGLKLIGMTIPFVVIGIWMLTQEPYGTTKYIMAWVSICFFGLGIPIGIFHIFDKRPQIIINELGVWSRTTKQDEIKWEQIKEAYPLDVFGSKLISIVVDDTYIFKKKQYKWAAKINKKMGAEKFNLNLGAINIDVNKLTDLINNLSKSNKEDRRIIIQSFKIKKTSFSITDFLKIVLYIFISIGLLLLTFTGLTAFMTIIVVMGFSAVIGRWYWGKNENSVIRKYAEMITWFGFVNMVLFLVTIKSYDYITESVGEKVSDEIEIYKNQHSSYPNNLTLVNKNIELNLLENYFANKVEYNSTDTTFELKLVNLFKNQKTYNQKTKEWE